MPHSALMRWCLSGVALVVVVDLSVVAVALPAIRHDLGFSVAGVQWALTGYALAQAGLLLVAGRLGDRLGRRRTLIAGLGLFGVSSVAAAAAVAPWMLVAARVLQGVGGAAMLPNALALLTTNVFGPTERERALGLFSAMSGSGFVLGVIAGGVLTQYVGWRAVMLLSVPVAAALIPLTMRAVPESRLAGPPQRLDVAGAITLVLGLASLIYGLLRIEPDGITAPAVWASLLASAALLAAFARVEAVSPAPIIPLPTFRNRTLAASNAANTLKSAVGMAQLYVLTVLLQDVLGATPLQTGIAFVPMALASVAGASFAGRYQSHLGGVRGTAVLGCLFLLVGLLLLTAQIQPAAAIGGIIAAMVVVEAGFMTAEVPLNLAASTALPERQGLAAGFLNTTTELGNALGLGLTAAVVGLRSSAMAHQPAADALASGLRWGLGVGIGAVLFAAGITLWGLRNVDAAQ